MPVSEDGPLKRPEVNSEVSSAAGHIHRIFALREGSLWMPRHATNAVGMSLSYSQYVWCIRTMADGSALLTAARSDMNIETNLCMSGQEYNLAHSIV